MSNTALRAPRAYGIAEALSALVDASLSPEREPHYVVGQHGFELRNAIEQLKDDARDPLKRELLKFDFPNLKEDLGTLTALVQELASE